MRCLSPHVWSTWSKIRNSYASKRIRTQISSKVVWSTRYLIHLAMNFSNQLKTSPWYLLYNVLEQVKTGGFVVGYSTFCRWSHDSICSFSGSTFFQVCCQVTPIHFHLVFSFTSLFLIHRLVAREKTAKKTKSSDHHKMSGRIYLYPELSSHL